MKPYDASFQISQIRIHAGVKIERQRKGRKKHGIISALFVTNVKSRFRGEKIPLKISFDEQNLRIVNKIIPAYRNEKRIGCLQSAPIKPRPLEASLQLCDYIEEAEEDKEASVSYSSCRERRRMLVDDRFDSTHGAEYRGRKAERRKKRERERVDRRGTGKRHGVEKRIAGG